MTWLDLLVRVTLAHDPQLGLDAGRGGDAAAAARDLWIVSDPQFWSAWLGPPGDRLRQVVPRCDVIRERVLAALRAGVYLGRGINARTGQGEDVTPELIEVAVVEAYRNELRIGEDYRLVGLRFARAWPSTDKLGWVVGPVVRAMYTDFDHGRLTRETLRGMSESALARRYKTTGRSVRRARTFMLGVLGN